MSNDIKFRYTDSDDITHISNEYQTEYYTAIYVNDPLDENVILSYLDASGEEYNVMSFPGLGGGDSTAKYKFESGLTYFVEIYDLNDNLIQEKTQVYEVNRNVDDYVYGASIHSKSPKRVKAFNNTVGFIDTSNEIVDIASGQSWTATENAWVVAYMSRTESSTVYLNNVGMVSGYASTRGVFPIQKGQVVKCTNATATVYRMM